MHLEEASLPTDLDGRFAFAYSFDVFPHLDLHVQYRYLRQVHGLLEPGGRAVVHTANLKTPGGWERFASQPVPSIRGFFFVTPETCAGCSWRSLRHSCWRVVAWKASVPGNFYYRGTSSWSSHKARSSCSSPCSLTSAVARTTAWQERASRAQ